MIEYYYDYDEDLLVDTKEMLDMKYRNKNTFIKNYKNDKFDITIYHSNIKGTYDKKLLEILSKLTEGGSNGIF